MAEGDNPVSPSPPTISQILSFSHNQRPLGEEPVLYEDTVEVSFWNPAGPSRELAQRSDTDPGASGSAVKRLRPTEGGSLSDGGDQGGYRRPPPGSTRGVSRLGDSYMSIVDDECADDDFAPKPVVSRAASNISVGESDSESN
ncbi:hypothetical protein GGI08_008521, partial [Coemansia sp. S2]